MAGAGGLEEHGVGVSRRLHALLGHQHPHDKAALLIRDADQVLDRLHANRQKCLNAGSPPWGTESGSNLPCGCATTITYALQFAAMPC